MRRLAVASILAAVVTAPFSHARTPAAVYLPSLRHAMARPIATPPPAPRIDFKTEIQPILQRCTPCHFPGGKMYAELPFDEPKTVVKLNSQLFTRVKDERQQKLILEFVAQEQGK